MDNSVPFWYDMHGGGVGPSCLRMEKGSMKVLFLSLAGIRDIDAHGIYSDLLRVFARNGHEIYIITPAERRMGVETHLETPEGNDWHQNVHILFLKTGNIQKTKDC